MKQLYYSIQTLLRGRSSYIIKIVSLTMGLCVGIILFARIAFELSFDTYYKDPGRLCAMEMYYTINDETKKADYVMAPYPRILAETFPEDIESFTVVREWYQARTLFNGSVRFTPKMILADSLFFSTMGIELISGEEKELITPNILFLSEEFAGKVFGNENPVGKILMYNKEIPMTVKGVYANTPENSTLQHEVVISFATGIYHHWTSYMYNGDDSYKGFVRLRSQGNIDHINPYVHSRVIEKYFPMILEKDAKIDLNYQVKPIRELYIGFDEVRRMVIIMSVLAFALLFITAMNYVLISVSSLPQRAKAIGVHKCSGASSGSILSMFMWETGIIICVSLLAFALIIFNFKDPIEDMVAAHLSSLFSWQTIWLPALMVLLLFLLAGLLPGYLLASIPVTQVFRCYTEKKGKWKQPLLFIQFAGVAFIFGLMCVVLLQYDHLVNKDLGYNPQRVAIVYHRFADAEAARDNIRHLPIVEQVATSGNSPISGYGGNPVCSENGTPLFTSRLNVVDLEYTGMMNIPIKAGKLIDAPDQVLVNEEFVRRMKWTNESALGKIPHESGGPYGTIVGVMADFPVYSFYEPQQPVLFVGQRSLFGCFHVRLKEPFEENLRELNRRVGELFPTEDVMFESLPQAITDRYQSAKRFRDATILSSVAIFLITLMGLFGYTNDEVRRRSKEIAIRKVNGAEASNVLALLCKGITWIAIPSVLIGLLLSYFVGQKWLDQFSEQIPLNPVMYIIIAIFLLALIVSGVILRTWQIANENPVRSIKSE